MVTGPPKEPVTRPEDTPTEALALLALHAPPALLLRRTDVPIHTLLLLPVISDGRGLTDTVTPPVVVQPAPDVAVTLYRLAPVASGVIEGDAQLLHERPPAPDMPTHVKVDPGAIAVKEAELLRHTVAEDDGEILSTGSALTVTVFTAEQPVESV